MKLLRGDKIRQVLFHVILDQETFISIEHLHTEIVALPEVHEVQEQAEC